MLLRIVDCGLRIEKKNLPFDNRQSALRSLQLKKGELWRKSRKPPAWSGPLTGS